MTTATRRPPPSPNLAANNGAAKPAKVFVRRRGIARTAWKIGIYGPEGVGKSSLAAQFPGIVFLDLEHSTLDMNVERIEGVENWTDLRAFVQQAQPGDVPAFCVDSVTRAEDWCAEYVIATKQDNQGGKAKDSLEDFKYKAGLTFVCDEFRRFLGDLDNACMRGITVLMVAHNRIARFRNPDGSDYIRNEPRLLNEEKGGNMLPWIQFLDHLFFIDYDVAVMKGQKAVGSGSRTIYTAGTPARMAKTRTLDGTPLIFEKGSGAIWNLLSGGTSDGPPAE